RLAAQSGAVAVGCPRRSWRDGQRDSLGTGPASGDHPARWTLGRGVVAERREVVALQVGEAEAAGAADDQVAHRPTQAEAARLAGEPADDLGPTAHLLQRAFEQVRRAQPRTRAWREPEVHVQGWEVLGQAGGRARVVALELAHQPA